jgi:predicted RNase H-like HicB family nuclease
MDTALIVVKAARDEEAQVWFVESSDLPGLNLEADTLDALMEKLPGAVLDLIEEGALHDDAIGAGRDVPIELIAHASTRLRIPVGS